MGDKQGHPFRGNQWTDRVSEGGGSAAVIRRGDYMAAPSGVPTPDDNPTGEMTKAGRELLAQHETSIQKQTWETAVIFDSKGKALLRKSGDDHSVNFTPDEIEKMRGGVLTHNHPSSSPLSDDDVQLALIKGLREIRAIGKDGSLSRLGTRGEGWTTEMLRDYREIRDNIMNNTRMLVGTGRITVEEANAGAPAEREVILTQFARSYARHGVYYRSTRNARNA